MARLLPLALAAALVSTSAAAMPGEPKAPRAEARDIVYRDVDAIALRLDVYEPPSGASRPAPVLVHFHGGGWARGQRPESWTGFRPYLNAGMGLVTVQYRLAGQARAPAAVQDARCALKWVADHAERFGFDPARIIVTGTSAGGHLAAMAAYLPPDNDIDSAECRGAPRAAALIDFYGPTNLTQWRPAAAGRHPTIARWIGEGADAARLERHMSPLHWLSSDAPPTFIVHGDADPVVPFDQSVALKQRLDALGVAAEMVRVPGGGHGRFSPEWRADISRRAVAFLCGQGLLEAISCPIKK
ncbi:alpha/beta hydrolase [Sphingopyxis sp. MWB1]|uniref:alpha/beta hydrolase n=1 Tax=Sphingopyxis sp. MWB1 TaxID=1537715 RepID=UPI00136248AA|nr:alpha/beta hydrolase [Sphingopyxis sp. MWB1]